MPADESSSESVENLFESMTGSGRVVAPEFDRADPNRLTTGIDSLDRYLEGGIPPGRMLSIVAPADTQTELLVKQFAACHDCLYLSTHRPTWEVAEEVPDHVQTASSLGRSNALRIEQLDPDERLDDARRYVDAIDDSTIVVVDSIDELEAYEKPRYVGFLDHVKERLWETGSVGVFYGI